MTTQHAMPFEELERIYEALAIAIDRVGVERESLMLAKLVLLLAQSSSHADHVLACLQAAELHCRPTSARQPNQTPDATRCKPVGSG